VLSVRCQLTLYTHFGLILVFTEDPGSISGQSTWHLCWAKWHWARFFSAYFSFHLSVSFRQFSILIFILVLRRPSGEVFNPWAQSTFTLLCLQRVNPTLSTRHKALLCITLNVILMVMSHSQQYSLALTPIIKRCHVLQVKGKRKILQHNCRQNQPSNDVYREETSAPEPTVLKSFRVTIHEISSNFNHYETLHLAYRRIISEWYVTY
jgi:hypothetical protein